MILKFLDSQIWANSEDPYQTAPNDVYLMPFWWNGLFVWVQQFFSHITMVSGSDRQLNAHFYRAASLKYHVPDTWHDTTPSHIILTLGRPVLALPRKPECQARSS